MQLMCTEERGYNKYETEFKAFADQEPRLRIFSGSEWFESAIVDTTPDEMREIMVGIFRKVADNTPGSNMYSIQSICRTEVANARLQAQSKVRSDVLRLLDLQESTEGTQTLSNKWLTIFNDNLWCAQSKHIRMLFASIFGSAKGMRPHKIVVRMLHLAGFDCDLTWCRPRTNVGRTRKINCFQVRVNDTGPLVVKQCK